MISLRKIRFAISLTSVISLAAVASASYIIPAGNTWEYTFADPTGGSWSTSSGGWSSGTAPFGNQVGGDFGYNTYWPIDTSITAETSDDLWVRTTLDLTGYPFPTTATPVPFIRWDLGVDNGFKLYANGNLIQYDNRGGYTNRWEYSGDFGSSLIQGNNYIAVALNDYGGYTAFDMQTLIKGDFGGNEDYDSSYNYIDGLFDNGDIEGFFLALNDESYYNYLNPELTHDDIVFLGDFGGALDSLGNYNYPDGVFDNGDIEAFYLALNDPETYLAGLDFSSLSSRAFSSPINIPEPSRFVILISPVPLVLQRRRGQI